MTVLGYKLELRAVPADLDTKWHLHMTPIARIWIGPLFGFPQHAIPGKTRCARCVIAKNRCCRESQPKHAITRASRFAGGPLYSLADYLHGLVDVLATFAHSLCSSGATLPPAQDIAGQYSRHLSRL